ncbi:hypothetical protein LL912_00365 [Niabella sp. CC-SYL272]|uniref:hypothetical protein n=1 Tax=Niabella agricola TaxID=2891571 RepID=UPI001F358B8A|nr:hypothetical protein [Niabella agricola]MCF3107220.1 hypothetical protein [Niabella agricola]
MIPLQGTNKYGNTALTGTRDALIKPWPLPFVAPSVSAGYSTGFRFTNVINWRSSP